MADIGLHNRTIDNTPELDDRLAYGKQGVNAKNITMAGLIDLIAAAISNPQGLITSVVNIGDWDMANVFTISKTPTQLGVSHVNKIRGFQALIYADSDTGNITVNDLQRGGAIYINNTTNLLVMSSGTIFQDPAYNATSYNRGFLTIQYIP